MVSSKFGASVIVIWVIGGMNIVSLILTSLPLTKKFTKNCREKFKSICCKKNTRNNSSSTDNQSSATSPTAAVTSASRTGTTTTRTVATSTSCSDLSMVKMSRPPSYSEHCNSSFTSYTGTDRPRNNNASSTPNIRRSNSNPSDQNSTSRPSTRGIFTVLVNPTQARTSESQGEFGSLQSSAQTPPMAPPPRYEEIIMGLPPQPCQPIEPPSAPPPPYSSTGSGTDGSSGPIQLVSLRTESRGVTSPPSSQSDV